MATYPQTVFSSLLLVLLSAMPAEAKIGRSAWRCDKWYGVPTAVADHFVPGWSFHRYERGPRTMTCVFDSQDICVYMIYESSRPIPLSHREAFMRRNAGVNDMKRHHNDQLFIAGGVYGLSHLDEHGKCHLFTVASPEARDIVGKYLERRRDTGSRR